MVAVKNQMGTVCKKRTVDPSTPGLGRQTTLLLHKSNNGLVNLCPGKVKQTATKVTLRETTNLLKEQRAEKASCLEYI